MQPAGKFACGRYSQCGCAGGNTSTHIIKYHKTGCVLGAKLAEALHEACGYDHGEKVAQKMNGVPAYAKRCSLTSWSIDENNYQHYLGEVLQRQTRPRPGLRLVHFVREPLRLVASYYTYHRRGMERDRWRYVELWERISTKAFVEGLHIVAALVLKHQLPIMLQVHDLLKDREDALEIDLEGLEAAFDAGTSLIAALAGVAPSCVASGSHLYAAFAKHDTSRWSRSEKELNSHIGLSPSAALLGAEASNATVKNGAKWRQEQLQRWGHTEGEAFQLLLQGEWPSKKLMEFGRSLGYEYPPRLSFADLPPRVLPPRASPSAALPAGRSRPAAAALLWDDRTRLLAPERKQSALAPRRDDLWGKDTITIGATDDSEDDEGEMAPDPAAPPAAAPTAPSSEAPPGPATMISAHHMKGLAYWQQREIIRGGRGAVDLFAGSSPAALTQAQREARCERFSSASPPFDVHSVGVTHVPKAGGSSLQQLLLSEAKASHKAALNVHVFAAGHLLNGSTTLESLRTAAAKASILIGHGSFDYFMNYLRWRPNASMITMLRRPSDRLESEFRYQSGHGEEFADRVLAQGASLQAHYDRFLQSHSMDTTALQMHRRNGSSQCVSHSATGEHRFCNAPMFPAQVANTTRFIAERYAVVGILEREVETMEVLRCRLPWIRARSLPHSRHNAQTWTYPVKLRANRSAVRLATSFEDQLYAFANDVLTADVECCRRTRDPQKHRTKPGLEQARSTVGGGSH